jgi:hypothetical protein
MPLIYGSRVRNIDTVIDHPKRAGGKRVPTLVTIRLNMLDLASEGPRPLSPAAELLLAAAASGVAARLLRPLSEEELGKCATNNRDSSSGPTRDNAENNHALACWDAPVLLPWRKTEVWVAGASGSRQED